MKSRAANEAKNSPKAKGKVHECNMTLEEIQAELAELADRAHNGYFVDENRVDYLLKAQEENPEYQAFAAAERQHWRESIADFCEECLRRTRTFIPLNIFDCSYDDLVKLGIEPELARRVLQRQCLWLVRMSTNEISRLHEYDLLGRYNSLQQHLDIIETAAVYVSLPDEFKNDTSSKKKGWKDAVEENLRKMLLENDEDRLPDHKIRNPAYGGVQFGPVKDVESVRTIEVVSSEASFQPNRSFRELCQQNSILTNMKRMNNPDASDEEDQHDYGEDVQEVEEEGEDDEDDEDEEEHGEDGEEEDAEEDDDDVEGDVDNEEEENEEEEEEAVADAEAEEEDEGEELDDDKHNEEAEEDGDDDDDLDDVDKQEHDEAEEEEEDIDDADGSEEEDHDKDAEDEDTEGKQQAIEGKVIVEEDRKKQEKRLSVNEARVRRRSLAPFQTTTESDDDEYGDIVADDDEGKQDDHDDDDIEEDNDNDLEGEDDEEEEEKEEGGEEQQNNNSLQKENVKTAKKHDPFELFSFDAEYDESIDK